MRICSKSSGRSSRYEPRQGGRSMISCGSARRARVTWPRPSSSISTSIPGGATAVDNTARFSATRTTRRPSLCSRIFPKTRTFCEWRQNWRSENDVNTAPAIENSIIGRRGPIGRASPTSRPPSSTNSPTSRSRSTTSPGGGPPTTPNHSGSCTSICIGYESTS